MKVKEWIEELKCYDENFEVVFTLRSDVDVDVELKEVYVCECCGECSVDLVVKE